MKQEISQPVLIGIIVAIVIVVGLIGWKVLAGSQNSVDTAAVNARIKAKRND